MNCEIFSERAVQWKREKAPVAALIGVVPRAVIALVSGSM